ncbi:MAG: hypothetical protein GY716_13180 [bacterium]|nr:hypothetical protein [bacterium]
MSDSIAYISFCARIRPDSVERLIRACSEQVALGTERVYMAISSPGGSVDSALAAYNLLRGMPFHLVTHNVGSVDSMGNVLFLAGDERYACPNSSFMFHGVGFNVSNKSRFELKTLREKIASIEEDQRKIAAIMVERTELTEEVIDGLFLETVTRGAEYALQHGIIDDVCDIDIPPGTPIVHQDFAR